MNKTKLAICMEDLEYQMRFVNCFMNHYNHQYELHVFTDREQLLESPPKQYAVIITGEYNTEEMTKFVERGEILVCLTENFEMDQNVLEENVIQIEKYQEVYHIEERLEHILANNISGYNRLGNKNGYQRIGIYSLSQEKYQIPFTALLAKMLGTQQKVLVIDLQQYSGLCTMEEGMNFMGLEDLLSAVMTGNCSRSRIVECIRHEPEWDYICAVQNNECLAEGTKELYDALIDLVVNELGYQTILLNFGSLFWGQVDVMEGCQTIYLLCEKEDVENWREAAFFQQILRRGKNEFLQRIRKISIPATSDQENTWRTLVEEWNWGNFGEKLRHWREKEMTYGAVM